MSRQGATASDAGQASQAEAGAAQQASGTPEAAQLRDGAPLRFWRRNRVWVQELGLVVVMYYLYSALRSAIKGDQELTIAQASCAVKVPGGGGLSDQKAVACAHAEDLEWLQHALNIDWELTLNRLFLNTPWLSYFGSAWYQLAHMLVTFGVLAWLFARRRAIYGRLRTSLVLLWLVGLTTYWAYPLAPPRFALDGAQDAMDAYPILFSGVKNVAGLANLYAAMPSLHVGWATWVAIALIVAIKSPWRWLAVLYPMTTTFVVLGTANHYLLDGVVGAAFAIGCWLLSREIYRRAARWRDSKAQAVQSDAQADALAG